VSLVDPASLVPRRPAYIINNATAGGIPIFEPEPNDGFNLNGGRPLPAHLVIEWKNILPDLGNPTARKPRKIDTKLSPPLTSLPGSAVLPPDPTIHLAVGNTLRGKRVGPPSGQQVAKAMRPPSCPTRPSDSATIRDGKARHRCGSTF
jgi:hypothetical protein